MDVLINRPLFFFLVNQCRVQKRHSCPVELADFEPFPYQLGFWFLGYLTHTFLLGRWQSTIAVYIPCFGRAGIGLKYGRRPRWIFIFPYDEMELMYHNDHTPATIIIDSFKRTPFTGNPLHFDTGTEKRIFRKKPLTSSVTGPRVRAATAGFMKKTSRGSYSPAICSSFRYFAPPLSM